MNQVRSPGNPLGGLAIKAYSLDLRQRIKACDAGMSTREVATKYEVSESWVRRLKQRRRETGSIAPQAQRHGPQAGWVQHADKIAQALKQEPDITLAELRDRLGLGLSISTLWWAIEALGLTVKKNLESRRAGPS